MPIKRKVMLVVLPAGLLIGLAGCATEKPVLYGRVGSAPPGGARAVSACMARAKSAGLDYAKGRVGRRALENSAVGAAGGAAAGAIYGHAGRGAAAGGAGVLAAGLVRGLFDRSGAPSPVYRRYVNRCLRDRGYQPIGWQ